MLAFLFQTQSASIFVSQLLKPLHFSRKVSIPIALAIFGP